MNEDKKENGSKNNIEDTRSNENITSELKNALTSNIFGKLSSLLNIRNLNNFKKKLDPRNYNGAILLGLDSPVVKSHGGTDFIGFANSLKVCKKIVKGKLIEKIKYNINS